MTTCPDHRRQCGFVLPAAIFLLVIVSLLGSYMVSLSSSQQVSSAQDVLGSRAYWAARAAAENAMEQVLQPADESGATVFANCATPSVTLTGDLASFSGFIASCVRSPATGYDTDPATGYNFVSYTMTARADTGTPGSVGFFEREISVTVVKCKNPDAVLGDGTTADPRNRCG